MLVSDSDLPERVHEQASPLGAVLLAGEVVSGLLHACGATPWPVHGFGLSSSACALSAAG